MLLLFHADPVDINANMGDDHDLCGFVHDICCCSKRGGRVYRLADHGCIVSDIPEWTDDMTLCLKSRFPAATVSVRGATDSITGFNVMIIDTMVSQSTTAKCFSGVSLIVMIFTSCVLIWWTFV